MKNDKKLENTLFKDDKTYEFWLKNTLNQGESPYFMPFNRFSIDIKLSYFDSMPFYILNSEFINNRETSTDISRNKYVILYLHGGAFVSQPSIAHWNFLNMLSYDTNSEILVPFYPKVPFYDAVSATKKLIDFYCNFFTSKKPVIFMGDSSGGGLALSLAEQIKVLNLKKPKQIILFSPWLDISMSNKEIAEIEPYDDFLSLFVLKKIAALWKSNLDYKDPLVSPLFGNVTSLGKISIFTGTSDILHPDSRALCNKLNTLNIPVNYIERKGRMHAYNILTSDGLKLEYSFIKQLVTQI